MTREQDWRIHEYMGNDLTGWEWPPIFGSLAGIAIKIQDGVELKQTIPHYSTTWEGAGLVMEWLIKNNDGFSVGWSLHKKYRVVVNNTLVHDDSAPQALAKAYIAAMEERDNG